MRVVAMAVPVSPAASANGTVRPSAIPITTSRTVSDAWKCLSTCARCIDSHDRTVARTHGFFSRLRGSQAGRPRKAMARPHQLRTLELIGQTQVAGDAAHLFVHHAPPAQLHHHENIDHGKKSKYEGVR